MHVDTQLHDSFMNTDKHSNLIESWFYSHPINLIVSKKIIQVQHPRYPLAEFSKMGKCPINSNSHEQ